VLCAWHDADEAAMLPSSRNGVPSNRLADDWPDSAAIVFVPMRQVRRTDQECTGTNVGEAERPVIDILSLTQSVFDQAYSEA